MRRILAFSIDLLLLALPCECVITKPLAFLLFIHNMSLLRVEMSVLNLWTLILAFGQCHVCLFLSIVLEVVLIFLMYLGSIV